MSMNFTLIVAVVLSAVSAFTSPQQHQHGPEQLGTVKFETSCAAAAQPPFLRGMALLHSFEFGPAIESFNAAAAADPGCGIAHWGVALSRWGNPFAAGIKGPAVIDGGRAAVASAKKAGARSERERAFIDAVALLFNPDTPEQRARVLAYREAMKGVASRYPNDPEAAAFYALAIASSQDPTDMTYGSLLEAGSILEKLAPTQPDHPGFVHYIIHSYDAPPLASRALTAAQRYAKIAPSAPHALHMPSHTFTRVGYWKESIETNRRSADAARKSGGVGEELHALDYQTYAYLQIAQDKAAKAVVDHALSVPGAASTSNATGATGATGANTFALAAIPARYALERGDWAAAAQLTVTPANGTPHTEAITHFARALGAARGGNPSAATADIARLGEIVEKLKSMQDAYWSEQVDIQRRVATAWQLFAQGQKDQAIAQLQSAADAEDLTEKAAVTPGPLAPARELLGFMLLDAGRHKDALAAFEATMKKEPNRFRGTYGAARAAELSGDRAKARTYYQQLLEIAKDADTERPELIEARKAIS
jgi:hypothetical protein